MIDRQFYVIILVHISTHIYIHTYVYACIYIRFMIKYSEGRDKYKVIWQDQDWKPEENSQLGQWKPCKKRHEVIWRKLERLTQLSNF